MGCAGQDRFPGSEEAMAMLDHAKEYPVILPQRSMGFGPSACIPSRGAGSTQQDGKSDVVCGGASPTGPATDPWDDRARV